MILLWAEVSKSFYTSKAKSSNVRYFVPPIVTVHYAGAFAHPMDAQDH